MMDTKTHIIEISTKLFQQKGYLGVGLSEILKACELSKGTLYHHFPNGKEELLIACLSTSIDFITDDVERVFNNYNSTLDAVRGILDQLIRMYEQEGTIASYSFISIVSEMSSLSDSIRQTWNTLFERIQSIYFHKLIGDGYSTESATSLAVMLTATVEGGIVLCLAQKSSLPLRTISRVIPNLLKE